MPKLSAVPASGNGPLHPEIPAARICRSCEAPITGPDHHTLCKPCWTWRRHRAATRALVRHFAEVRP